MTYNRGDIVVVKFPFGTREKETQKGRPALVISDSDLTRRYNDNTLAAITSQVPEKIMGLEIMLEPDKSNGLVKKSLLRLDFIMTIPSRTFCSNNLRTIQPLYKNGDFRVRGGLKMTIKSKLAVVLAEKEMKLTELEEKTGISLNNLSILKTGKAKAVRFSTLNEVCKALNCQPGDILQYIPDEEEERK